MALNLEDMEQRLKALEDMVFERGLSVRDFDKVALALHLQFDLPRSKTMMLRHLLLENLLTKGAIIEIVDHNGGHNKRGSAPIASAHMNLLRKAIDRFNITIHNARGTGFYLDAETKARIRKLCGIEQAAA